VATAELHHAGIDEAMVGLAYPSCARRAALTRGLGRRARWAGPLTPRFGYAADMASFAWTESTPPRRWLLALAMALGISLVGASCASEGLAIMPGVVNNPANLTLRRALFGFASGQICSEFLLRNIPLQLRDDDPATGRFFPTACAVRELETGHLFLQFSGRGYAWTNVTGRLGFEASAAVEYAMTSRWMARRWSSTSVRSRPSPPRFAC
jgi:hypothetical protein